MKCGYVSFSFHDLVCLVRCPGLTICLNWVVNQINKSRCSVRSAWLRRLLYGKYVCVVWKSYTFIMMITLITIHLVDVTMCIQYCNNESGVLMNDEGLLFFKRFYLLLISIICLFKDKLIVLMMFCHLN